MTDEKPLEKPVYVEGDPREIQLLDINARYMTRDQYARLVRNVKKDGHLTSTPLVWRKPDGTRIVLSGNHRVKAAVDAELESIGWLEITEPLERQRMIALQLSHNEITGQDDPAILKQLWEELESIEWREYAALDDKTLETLEDVDLGSLGEAPLDYLSVQVMFLPSEVDRAKAAFQQATDLVQADERWMSREEDYDRLLDALDSARESFNIANTAAAFTILLDVFERHLGDLKEGWLDEVRDDAVKHNKWVPLESLFETRRVPTDAAAIIHKAIRKARDARDVDHGSIWRVLELWAADYLAGA